MRRIRLDVAELASAFEGGSQGMHYYLDLATGKVVSVTDGAFERLERLYEEDGAPEGQEPTPPAELLARADLMDWEGDAGELELAAAVEDRERYRPVPISEARTDWSDMADYATTVEDPGLRAQLQRALDGPRPFRRFKDVLAGDRRTEQRWFAWRNARLRQLPGAHLSVEGVRARDPVELRRPALWPAALPA